MRKNIRCICANDWPYNKNRLRHTWQTLLTVITDSCCSGVMSHFQITKFMGPTWGSPGFCRAQMGPMLAPWTLPSGLSWITWQHGDTICLSVPLPNKAYENDSRRCLIIQNMCCLRIWYIYICLTMVTSQSYHRVAINVLLGKVK